MTVEVHQHRGSIHRSPDHRQINASDSFLAPGFLSVSDNEATRLINKLSAVVIVLQQGNECGILDGHDGEILSNMLIVGHQLLEKIFAAPNGLYVLTSEKGSLSATETTTPEPVLVK